MLTTTTSSGTLLYISPQQLDGERLSPLDDIYSVGATLYELLTRKPPFFSGGIERQIREKPSIPMMIRRQDLGITSTVQIPEASGTNYRCLFGKGSSRSPAERERPCIKISR